ncbi:hypothetical protein BH20ACT2_BH20ACT2_23630 [soil metagenome]
MVWGDRVLPSLPGLARAMYGVGRFVDVSGGAAVFALPNAMHRDKCEEKRADVEAVLARQLGRPVPLRLVVDEPAGPQATTGAASGASGGAIAEADEDIDVHGLVDAPVDDRSGVDVLTEAFPGAEMINEEST